ncbi:Crp/Fnr family transcriptional regulator [Glacieibacterium frigidum]|uniref:Crp/Fnr family transcriptional regulator n=2 Tax=Glacieibacterium frigidum TaxID=2593303 RepID=A0A552UJN0_9SPHN|nr:Crp/Fnr family transcriptional regulator [Glacieibacterium frigidum]
MPPELAGKLTALLSKPRDIPARQDLMTEGDAPAAMVVMLEGWACRYNILPEGTRQISAFLMPGDCCDLHVSVLTEMDHSIATLTPAKVAHIQRDELNDLLDAEPALMRAFWWMQLVNESVMRAWIVSMGRRDSLQRVGHLMLELYARATAIGLVRDDRLVMPLTQIVIGDALGLTPVHVNRVLRRLREEGVMEIQGGTLTIADSAKLARVTGFDDSYLHRRLKRAA